MYQSSSARHGTWLGSGLPVKSSGSNGWSVGSVGSVSDLIKRSAINGGSVGSVVILSLMVSFMGSVAERAIFSSRQTRRCCRK